MKKYNPLIVLIISLIVFIFWELLSKLYTHFLETDFPNTTPQIIHSAEVNSNTIDVLGTDDGLATSVTRESQTTLSDMDSQTTYQATPAPQPTPTLKFFLPPIYGDVTLYSIRTPEPETIIELQLSRSGQMAYSDTQLDDLLYPAYHDIIDYEWKSAYTHTLYSDELFHLIPNFYDHSRGRLTNRILTDLIGDHITSSLNFNKLNLIDRTTFTINNFYGSVFKLEIDGDPYPEWLVEVKDKGGFYLSSYSFWMTLDQVGESNFRRLKNQLPWIWGISSINSPEFQLSDITGDGMTDIVLMDTECQIGVCNRKFHIAIANESGHYLISTTPNMLDNTDLTATEWAEIQWNTSPVNNLPILRLTFFKDIGWECVTSTTFEYQWVDGKERVMSLPQVEYRKIEKPILIEDTQNNPNQQAKCLIAKSLESGFQDDVPSQIYFLEACLDLIHNLSEEDQIFLLYRLAVLHAINGNGDKSQLFIDKISEIAKQGKMTIGKFLMDQINNILIADNLNPYTLCLAAENLSIPGEESLEKTPFELPRYYYVGVESGYPSPLCDSSNLLSIYLETLIFDPDQSIEKGLEKVGIQTLITQDIKTDLDKKQGVVIIEERNPYKNSSNNTFSNPYDMNELIVYWYDTIVGWEELFITEFNGDISYNLEDISRDGIIDFAFSLPAKSSKSSYCYNDEQATEVFLIASLTKDIFITFTDTNCVGIENPLDYPILLQDVDRDGVIDIIEKYFEENLFDLSLLTGDKSQSKSVIFRAPYNELAKSINKDVVLTDLTKRVLENKNLSEAVDELLFYKELWGKDENLGDYIQAQCNYLLAMAYQQMGETQKSAIYFYETWENLPATIWAYLASSHLVLNK